MALVEEVKPIFSNGPPDHNVNGAWNPPKTCKEFEHIKSYLFRFDNFTVTQLGSNAVDPGELPKHLFATASVFTQYPHTPLLLAVNESVRIEKKVGPWHTLRFGHVIQPDTTHSFYSSVDFAGQDRTAARMSPNCAPELLPECYNPSDAKSKRAHAGLIGRLPLLIALAAFSAKREHIVQSLANICRGPYRCHERASGRRKS